MLTAVIIVTYKNTSKSLERIRKSLQENGIKQKDIYFSDNTKENLGYGGGVNRILKGILKHSKSAPSERSQHGKNNYDAYFIVNPDVFIHKDCIKKLTITLESNKNIGVVGPKILDEEGKIWSLGGELDKKRYSGGLIDYGKTNNSGEFRVKKVDFVSGTAMLVKREVFEKIGFFAEDYFLYYEDVDFCIRVKRAGFYLTINPKAVITHYASSTIGVNSPMQQYYMARNHMWFVARYAPLAVKLHEFLRLPKTLYEAKDKKFELFGLWDYFLRKGGRHDYWS